MKVSLNIISLDERGQNMETLIDIGFELEDRVYVKNSEIIVSGKRTELEFFVVEETTFNITIKTHTKKGSALQNHK